MEELISKKELLELAQISYGQLYRWKRKNIIPETWFIKKSVPSGQETFFPRQKILERIETIVNMKDEASLDDLAKMFNAEVGTDAINLAQLIKSRLLTEESVALYKQATAKANMQAIEDVLSIKIFKDYVMEGSITLDEGKMLARFIEEHYNQLNGEMARVYLLRNMGMPLVVGTKNLEQMLFDSGYKVVMVLNIYEEVSTIKFQMME